MRALPCAVTFLLSGIGGLAAQNPDSLARARADSLARARVDSIRLVREIEAMGGRRDTTAIQAPAQQGRGPINPRLLPDISAVGDIVADFSPKGSTQENGSRLGVREVELQLIAAVDPYFRGEVLAAWSDAEGATLEQLILTTTSLPWGLQLRVGRVPLPFGKQNILHREALHTVEFPYAIQRFLSEEGLKANGVVASKVMAPFGFYQEILATVADRFGEAPEDLVAESPPSQTLKGLGYGLRLRNYWDLSENANLEISASGATGLREQPFAVPVDDITATLVRQTLVGLDVTYRWRPLQQGLYRSFLLQGEVMKQFNSTDVPPNYAGPARNFAGAYLLARYQLSRRSYVGARYDWVEDPEAEGAALHAGTLQFQFLPSEFSKITAAVERRELKGGGGITRLLLQSTFAIGPHRPHPF
ncbi:MAG: hypothetical protein ACT4PM_06840 [Gemmatimonadales bacterium]